MLRGRVVESNTKINKMIPTVREPKEMFENTGVYERCYFCKEPTNMWHWRTNQPVCNECKKTHKVSEIQKCTSGYKPITKKEYLSR